MPKIRRRPKRRKPAPHKCRTPGCDEMIKVPGLSACGICQAFAINSVAEAIITDANRDWLLSMPRTILLRQLYQHLAETKTQNLYDKYDCFTELTRRRAIHVINTKRSPNNPLVITREEALRVIANLQNEIPVGQIAKALGVPVSVIARIGEVFGLSALTPVAHPVSRPGQAIYFDKRDFNPRGCELLVKWQQAELEPIRNFPTEVQLPWLAAASSVPYNVLYRHYVNGDLKGFQDSGKIFHRSKQVISFLLKIADGRISTGTGNRDRLILCLDRLNNVKIF